jgi:hypothetical protein
MKKFISTTLLAVMIITLTSMFAGCTKDEEMLAYAENVYLNTEKYEVLKTQGMYILEWDPVEKVMNEFKTDTEEAKDVYDSTKPTIIFVHGWMLEEGRYGRYKYILEDELLNESEGVYVEDLDNEGNLYTTKLWLNEGWNVMCFHYNLFADVDNVTMEDSIYSAENGISFCYPDGSEQSRSENDATEYSISQFFAAEYIRTMANLTVNGEKEIRIGCHSMGGVLTSCGVNILLALVEDGQIAENLLPDRIAYLDTFCGFFYFLKPSFNTIDWSGEKIGYIEDKNGDYVFVDNAYVKYDSTISEHRNVTRYKLISKSMCFVNYIKNIDSDGIAIELCLLKGGTVPTLSGDNAILDVMEYAATVVYNPAMLSFGDKFSKGHNGVREWYFCSIASSVPTVGETATAISAASTIDEIKAKKGKVYYVNSASFDISNQTATEVEASLYKTRS